MDRQRYYLIGVCGSAMGGVAGLLKQQGHEVAGSDTAFYDPMGERLRSWGVRTFQGWDAENIELFRPDVVIVGNVTRQDNPEMARVVEKGIPYRSFPAFLEETFLTRTENIVVTGTHGKTTTSSLIAWLLEDAGHNPSYFIGGIPENFGRPFAVSAGRYFVLEGDEYDTAYYDKGPKFLHYRPTHGLVLNVELDHVDIYPSFEAVKDAFRGFTRIIDPSGSLTVCADDPPALEVTEKSPAERRLYGTRGGARTAPEDIRFLPDRTEFRLRTPEGSFGPFTMGLFGFHNVLNAAAAFTLWQRLGLSPDAFARGLATFKGVRRRVDRKGEVNGAQVYEDFGHHPTEIGATLAGLKQRFAGKKIAAAFRAESNTSRTPLFEPRYVDALEGADRVFLAATLAKRDYLVTERYFDPELVASELGRRGVSATSHPDIQALASAVKAEVGPGWLVVIFSSRGMDGLAGLLTTTA